MAVRKAIHNLNFIVRPCADVPGDWEAHCLEFDVLAQGGSAEQALRAAEESARVVVREDLKLNRYPYSRRAPQGYWDLRHAIITEGVTVEDEELFNLANEGHQFLAVFELDVVVLLDFEIVPNDSGPAPGPSTPGIAWKKAA